jgi:hypothetical protein
MSARVTLGDSEGRAMTNEELVVEFALTRLDNPGLDLEDIADLVVRRMGTDRMPEFAAHNLATRDELRGAGVPLPSREPAAGRLTLRGPAD